MADEVIDAFTAEALFAELFLRWYKPLEREIHGGVLPPAREPLAARPASELPEHARGVILRQLERMTQAAQQDQARFLPENGQLGALWLRTFERAFTVDEARNLAVMADPEDRNNDFVVLCCEIAAAFGHLLKEADPTLEWIPEAPYWESWLFRPADNMKLHPFAATLRFMSTSRDGLLSDWLT
ncbi:MAG: hypothetical protein KIT72_04120 [Polyangiaceae bacterium]|nr:hypothetical protein [Polyangiaceae bacterium]MCW5789590.1 hypothetical protein [Polyangiaceae bacterium]